jgi:hypothetical protein
MLVLLAVNSIVLNTLSLIGLRCVQLLLLLRMQTALRYDGASASTTEGQRRLRAAVSATVRTEESGKLLPLQLETVHANRCLALGQ